ncbi:hypothetical protein C1645_871115 [Glomus cerebriforme]|uniref:Uncharacterized protein n=1 Tax=Glomus cerebriforme TaxID=658196 RepID=A0A397TMS7_9GLOM|nr:hypothetical protein C1645_871115 [Glomus cerebriforme]
MWKKIAIKSVYGVNFTNVSFNCFLYRFRVRLTKWKRLLTFLFIFLYASDSGNEMVRDRYNGECFATFTSDSGNEMVSFVTFVAKPHFFYFYFFIDFGLDNEMSKFRNFKFCFSFIFF